jgi:tetratricopeptide (TPR) repeat protein
MSAKQRLQRFRELWKDYRSPKPSTVDLAAQIMRFAEHSPDAMAVLIQDPSTEAQFFASQLISQKLKDGEALLYDYRVQPISTTRYAPYISGLAELHRGMEQFQSKESYQPHPLLPALVSALTRQIEGGQVEPWLVMSWLNAQFPDQHEKSAKLAERLIKSPAWKAMPIRVSYGLAAHFPELVLSPAQQKLKAAATSSFVSRALLELKADASADAATEAVKATTQSILSAPFRIELSGLEQLAALSDQIWAEDAFIRALVEMIDRARITSQESDFGKRLLAHAAEARDPEFILPTAAYLWRVVERFHRPHQSLMELTGDLVQEQPQAASTLARIGLQVINRHTRGHPWFKAKTDIPLLKRIRGKSAMALGLVEIPVAANDSAYPVYLSQAEWMTDNIDTAWKLLDTNWDKFIEIHRSLSFSYTMWALQRSIDTRNEPRQELLIKALLSWSEEASSPLQPTEKAEIEIAYGDIAMQRGQLRQAHEIYNRVAQKEAYADLIVRHVSTLRKAAAERVAKDFDGALETLSELELERVPGLWVDVRYARAEVHYDMEAFEDAKDDVDSILAREPNQPDSKILLGKIQLKRQKLMEATEVELGTTTSQPSLVPGERLKVTLTDPTLAVSGAGTEVEVVVWTVTGDREQFFLRQFGDQKTKFRGEVATALGAPSPDDGTLQVIGDDEIYYAYSERFRKKMNNMEEKRGGPIGVASDALLMASSRKLLSAAEQRRADMEAIMEDIEGEISGGLEGAARAKLASQTLESQSTGDVVEDEFGRYLVNVAKPGNPIHVRVIDPDRSRTAEVDTLSVSVSTSSGDSIGRVTLNETGTHTGWFEGTIETASATARAFAQDTEPGLNPNMVISANTSYPAWRAIVREDRKPDFIVDLNDRVGLSRLSLTATEPGSAPRQFIVQTAPNHRNWTTVAAYPDTAKVIPNSPERPSVTVINEAGRNAHYGARSVYEIGDLRKHMEYGWFEAPEMATTKNVAGPSDALPASIPTDVKWLKGGRWENPAVAVRFKAFFHEDENVQRSFKLKLGKHNPLNGPVKANEKEAKQEAEFLLSVNGKVITQKEDKSLEGSINLKAGVHEFEIWATGWLSNIGFGRDVELLTRTSDEEEWTKCPDAFFNSAEFPEGSFDRRNAPAIIIANEAGTAFTVDFAPASEARLIRFLFVDQESPAPAINKIALTDVEGAQILPLEDDFAKLNKNSTLEMLTGDRITVRYRDDRFVTRNKENQERFLSVAFTDARIEFADMEPRWSDKHQQIMPYYERRIRFHHDQKLSIAIHDADMDTTVEPDKVPIILASENGKEKRFEATETGDSTGIFKLSIVPVSGAPQEANQFQVAEGGSMTTTYTDQENNRPGVVTERVTTIDHAAFAQPQFLIGHAEVSELKGNPNTEPLYHGFQAMFQRQDDGRRKITERVRPRWDVKPRFIPANEAPEGGIKAVLGQGLYLELVAPQYLLGTNSEISVYAQTESGRRAANLPAGTPFDINTPGTIELTGSAGNRLPGKNDWRKVPPINTYRSHYPWSSYQKPKNDRFQVATTVIAGVTPENGVLSDAELDAIAESQIDSRSAKDIQVSQNSLVAKPGDTIYFGFRYTNPEGQEQWETSTAKVVTHPAFDIMSEGYTKEVDKAYAGERLYLRVVDLGADVSDDIDNVRLLMQAKSGAKYYLTLSESGPHTGIFRDDVLLSYSREPGQLPEERDINREGLPITYGDTVAARYTDTNGLSTETEFVTISKGADGAIAPFSKVYEDEEMAMRTQFSLAEAYLEMAKRHRKLGQPEKADQEYRSAKMLLAKAMDQFTDPDTRAHAEYLLGTLTMEEADATEAGELRETRFRAALSRFMNVTGSYPFTIHASRAQYRIATVYEKLGESDIAAQEYVKLAYKYPDSEYLATSMARLGTHFLKKAAAYEQQAKPLLARAEEDKDAAYEGEALQELAVREYLKTASIFSRLQERFPSNKLAGPAGLRAGQAYMRADRKRDAIQTFNQLIHEESYDGLEVRAQAMYWMGMCYQDLREEMAAYSHFKRLTYDFPESKWASYARAQLSQERLLKLESELELERLEAGQ